MHLIRNRAMQMIHFGTAIGTVLAVATLGLVLPSNSYGQTTLIVCSSGCSYTTIAQAVAAAAAGDTISVQESVDSETTNVDIGNNLTLTIEGQGVSNTTVNGTGSAPVFTIESGSTVTIQDMTVSNGFNNSNGGGIVNTGTLTISDAAVSGNRVSASSGASGGGIVNYGMLTIDNSTVSSNSAYFGAGILNSSGTLTVTSSTFSGNTAAGSGGAIYNISGMMTVLNSTFSGNSAVNGGAIYNNSTSVTISFSTIADNSASSAGGGIDNLGTATIDNSIIGDNTGGDCVGTISAPATNPSLSLDTDGTCGTASFTQVGSTNLNLGALALNPPGTTETMALISPSSAIDAAPDCNDANGNLVAGDQRAVARPQGSACDIGAFELQPSTTGTSSVSTTIDLGLTSASNDSITGGSVTMGAFVHDNATVSTTVNPIPSGSSATFNVFPAASCGGTASSSANVSLTTGMLSESVESSGMSSSAAYGPLAVGGVAYQAAFNSGNTISVPSSTGACETLNVQSPISQFAYTLNSGTQLYTCTLESMTNGVCPSAQPEATVMAGTTNNFVIDVQLTNLTGLTVVESVQGSLARGKGLSYTLGTASCGSALIKNNGVLLWNSDGGHSPNSTGFTMLPGQTCDLPLTVTATFNTTGQQTIASQWSASQTETSPVTGQSITLTSPSTGSLAVDVQ